MIDTVLALLEKSHCNNFIEIFIYYTISSIAWMNMANLDIVIYEGNINLVFLYRYSTFMNYFTDLAELYRKVEPDAQRVLGKMFPFSKCFDSNLHKY